jgi:hypothetical protein
MSVVCAFGGEPMVVETGVGAQDVTGIEDVTEIEI